MKRRSFAASSSQCLLLVVSGVLFAACSPPPRWSVRAAGAGVGVAASAGQEAALARVVDLGGGRPARPGFGKLTVMCSPSFVVRSGLEQLDDHGVGTLNPGTFRHQSPGGMYDVQVQFTPNCPATAKTITRKVEFRGLATMSVDVS